MSARKTYNQNCPIAKGLDVLGERWTLLIVRGLLGDARRYSDLRAELPGIGTNLLAERLRELQDAGIVDRAELPPPIARTVYSLSAFGLHRVVPILRNIAWFGMDRIEPNYRGPVVPLNGFLAGILLAFDPARAIGKNASYRAETNGRRFEFAVHQGRLMPARGEPAMTVTAFAADLVKAREAKRLMALRRIKFEGDEDAVAALRTMCRLTADPDVPFGVRR